MRVVANLFSSIGTGLLAYSTFSKKKSKMLWIQVGDCWFNALGNLFVGSYAAMITNLFALVRNVLNATKLMSNWLLWILTLALICYGLEFNTKGFVGLLPVVASVEYTIWSTKSKNTQQLRIALAINLVLWFVHDCAVGLYPAMIVDVVVFATTLMNLARYRHEDFSC